MNRKTQSLIRKFKDTTNNYIWQPPASPSGRASLMNFPVHDVEDMPDIAANSLSVAFGDFKRGYLIVDRAGVTVLRDPYSAKPLCAVLYDQARRRRRAGLRRNQAAEVRGELTAVSLKWDKRPGIRRAFLFKTPHGRFQGFDLCGERADR